MKRTWVRLLWLTVLAAGGFLAAGCATRSGPSDIPWNAPQSWEGRPGFQGLDQR